MYELVTYLHAIENRAVEPEPMHQVPTLAPAPGIYIFCVRLQHSKVFSFDSKLIWSIKTENHWIIYATSLPYKLGHWQRNSDFWLWLHHIKFFSSSRPKLLWLRLHSPVLKVLQLTTEICQVYSIIFEVSCARRCWRFNMVLTTTCECCLMSMRKCSHLIKSFLNFLTDVW